MREAALMKGGGTDKGGQQMAPMVQPPSLAQCNAAEPVTAAPLMDTIHKLHDLLFKVVLPKTSGAKSVYVLVEDLLLVCSLATSMCASLQAHHVNPHLNNIHKKLETITTRLDTFAMAQPPANHSYTHIAATGAKNTTSPKACPSLHFELTLTQANRSHPVLLGLSNDGLLEKINEILMDTGCHFESRPCTPNCDGSVGHEYAMSCIRAVGCHRSGDIWLVTYSKAECDFLVGAAHCWVPPLPSQLLVAHKTFREWHG